MDAFLFCRFFSCDGQVLAVGRLVLFLLWFCQFFVHHDGVLLPVSTDFCFLLAALLHVYVFFCLLLLVLL